MLRKLSIRNYALIDRLEIDFSDHLTIITGETGAGKSILLGALGLVMGERADSKAFYNEGQKCVVEGLFEVKKHDLKAFFEENELDYDDELVVRRELSASGKSRAFINDTPVTNRALEQLTSSLVDLHQQFDMLDIHNVNFQLRMLDALAENRPTLAEYAGFFKQFQAEKRRLADLVARQSAGEKEQDFLRFQLEEFDRAELFEGEQDRLEAEQSALTNAEDIKRIFGGAAHVLEENEQAVLPILKELSRSVGAAKRFSPAFSTMAERLDSQILELAELAKDFEKAADSAEHDPARIADVQARLDVIYRLQKKHGAATVDELLKMHESLAARLAAFGDLGDEILSLERSLESLEKKLRTIAATLSERRKKVVAGFESRVSELLTLLSMPHARLKVAIEPLEKLSATGADDVQFLFATNIGSKFLPIKDVASGGELSRLNLCTKSIVADAIPLPTLIFDEIDSGISGDVSLKMGQILKELAARHQVVAITHTPQVAARADRHYFIYKKIEGERTVTNVRQLADDERVRAIATMLSGNPPSASALETAREMLG